MNDLLNKYINVYLIISTLLNYYQEAIVFILYKNNITTFNYIYWEGGCNFDVILHLQKHFILIYFFKFPTK